MPPGLGGRRSVDLPPFKERLVALRPVPRFLRMVWRAQPYYSTAIVSLRLVLAFSPVVQLWIGKLPTRGRMAVLISHRFSTVRMADRIVLLENGGVTEDGTHEELLALEGRYAELFTLQAAGYR